MAESLTPARPPAAELGGTAEEPTEEPAESDRPASAREAAIEMTTKAKKDVIALGDKVVSILKDPQFQTCTIATAGGTITIGAVGGAFGLATGIVTGSAVGVVPALLTFGLSIPVGGAIGGGMGLCAGAATGGSVGAAAGFGSYKYRAEIEDGVVYVETLALDAAEKGKVTALAAVDGTKSRVSGATATVHAKADELVKRARACTSETASLARAKVGEAVDFATGTKTGATCSSAAVGAVAGGVGGGTVGSVAGGAVGLIPALFTFGLSIPVGAAVGLSLGAAAGSTAGAVGGGCVGYGGFAYRKEIGECAQGVRAKARKAAAYVEDRVHGPAASKAAKAEVQAPVPVAGA